MGGRPSKPSRPRRAPNSAPPPPGPPGPRLGIPALLAAAAEAERRLGGRAALPFRVEGRRGPADRPPPGSDLAVILASVALVESGGDPSARREEPALRDASLGLCQLLRSTAAWLRADLGFDAYDADFARAGPDALLLPHVSLYLAGAYLAYLAHYGGVPRTEEFAVRCYNGGPPHGATLPATGRYWSKYAEAKALVLQELCPLEVVPGVGAADGDAGEGGWHVVAPGDTLWGIARLHQTSVAALLRANPALAADPDRISPGTRVRLPPP